LKPIYDISKTYLENAKDGPFFKDPIPPVEAGVKPVRFLGFDLNSPLGVPAGPLLNWKWVALAAKLGFDLPTYKTIRSFAHPGHPLPNIVFVERLTNAQAKETGEPGDLSELSITNSFGMPSMSPEFLMEDIGKANASLQPGQAMIVSVVGTPGKGKSFLDDFLSAACLAKEAGAQLIEANFSCPNVGQAEGCLYMNPVAVSEFTSQIAAAIRPVPLLLKVGLFTSVEQMRAVFLAAARASAAGIAGLNSVSMEVAGKGGGSALGASRRTSGVCGGAIRDDALRFMRDAAKIRQEEKLDLALLGCGGLMRPEDLEEMLSAGADIAMTATGMMWDPLLAIRYREMSHAHR